MQSRLEILEQFYAEDPSDPFNAYGLALEYQKFDLSKSALFFDELLDKHPSYLPTYYHAAAFFADLEQIEKAAQIYEKGIILAQKEQNIKALQELRNALMMLQD